MASFISKSSAFSVLWVQELYKTAEVNGVNVISYTHAALPHFFYTTLTVTAWVGMQNITAVKYVSCQLRTTKAAHFLMHKPKATSASY